MTREEKLAEAVAWLAQVRQLGPDVRLLVREVFPHASCLAIEAARLGEELLAAHQLLEEHRRKELGWW
jgi:hypothetical protein